MEIRSISHWEMLKFEEYRKKTITGIITKDRNDSCPESKDESNYEIETQANSCGKPKEATNLANI